MTIKPTADQAEIKRLTKIIDELHAGETALKAEIATLKDDLVNAVRNLNALMKGWKPRKRGAARPPISGEAMQRMREMISNGVDIDEIAREVGSSTTAVKLICKGMQFEAGAK